MKKLHDKIIDIFGDKKIFIFILAVSFCFLIIVVSGTCFGTGFATSGSMESMIMTGDESLYTKNLGKINRYDVVDIYVPYEKDGYNYGKRVIGLPGETIEVRKNGIYANGIKLDDSYISEENKKLVFGFGKYYIPEDCYFVLGDNRNVSDDSRTNFYLTFVKKEAIEAKYIYSTDYRTHFNNVKYKD